ncbi:hypothetical protein IMPR6_700179 [Imperialibacter sp. EC-SDR9]|nr:hypothetical protein IMPERIA89_340584 [Imperialibacter sp. 89]CAD5299053.1 hypothetical protein IMPERIA75_700584 [Imperialibacter sp. 75]VVT35131.1 hypothetical protein IMPR6_700179 [Imperialibacter sp. EC-SDR9]
MDPLALKASIALQRRRTNLVTRLALEMFISVYHFTNLYKSSRQTLIIRIQYECTRPTVIV